METLLNTRERSAPEMTMTVDLPRFGAFTFAESEIIRFPWGLPGFDALRKFLVISVSEEPSYLWLQSLDDLKVAIPLCDPWSIFDDYEAPLPIYAKQSLAIQTAESFCVLCVLVATPGAGTTINLLAPVIINLQTRVGRQIMLENQRYSVRTPVLGNKLLTKEDVPS